MKQAVQSKTLWFNSAVAMLMTAEQNLEAVQDVIPASWYAWILLGVTVVNAGLRVVTTKSLTFTKVR